MDKQPEHIMPLQLRGTKRPHPEEEGEVSKPSVLQEEKKEEKKEESEESDDDMGFGLFD
uniref:Uncharacterized protein n=1 Tax=Anguilla anguilla TaxID=7936 RepID=A0A0E9TW92_ANGAN